MANRKNRPVDVYRNIDMKGGDRSQCWPWTGGTGGRADDRRPYFTLDGKRVLAYRTVYELEVGPLKADELVRHTCDTPMCCNSYHFVKGSEHQNTQDKVVRERHGGLPRTVVRRIKLLWQTNQFKQKELADMFGVARETISSIVSGRRRSENGNHEE